MELQPLAKDKHFGATTVWLSSLHMSTTELTAVEKGMFPKPEGG